MKFSFSFNSTSKDQKILNYLNSLERGERSFFIKKVLFKAIFGEEY